MKTQTFARFLVVAGLCLFVGVAASWLPRLSWRLGAGDLTAYWSASYLLSHGKNFADPALLYEVERTQAHWNESWAFLTWNPPWLLALLIPYTWVSFDRAVWLWMFTSVGLVFASSMALWQLYTPDLANKRWVYLILFLAFFFPPTALALIAGQVNVLVLAGLAGFLYWNSKRQDFIAGAALALTMVKPHLVYITVPILLLDCLLERRWQVLAGFAAVLTGLSAVVFLLRPTFPFEYAATVGGGNLLAWQTTTLGGILDVAFGWRWSKLMCLVVLPLAIGVWWRYRWKIDLYTIVDVTLLVSVITAPYGWSYDLIVLLVPLLHVVAWVVNGEFNRAPAILFAAGLVLFYGLMFYQRTLISNEVEFFWVSIAAAGAYAACYAIKRKSARVSLGEPLCAPKRPGRLC
ncbi:MAG: hypothetical protein B6D41_00405 [Chloroflexi bacterium UTCFX4]|jgi:hypothetical protein|nr:MAG: hypothetical protein B6D41_00405 [Chloroflexi bacterium UTCFX4]